MSDVRIDARVLAFALMVSVATTLLFGLAPAWFLIRPDLMNTLREGGRGSTAGSALSARLLVVGELALALVLLTGAGLLTRSFAARAAWNPGFERDHLLTFSVFAPADRYKDRDAVAALLRRMENELTAIPGVERVGSASGGPLFGGDGTDDVIYSNRSGIARAPAAWYDMSPSYFATLGVAVVSGRGLSEADRRGMPTVVVVNETLSRGSGRAIRRSTNSSRCSPTACRCGSSASYAMSRRRIRALQRNRSCTGRTARSQGRTPTSSCERAYLPRP